MKTLVESINDSMGYGKYNDINEGFFGDLWTKLKQSNIGIFLTKHCNAEELYKLLPIVMEFSQMFLEYKSKNRKVSKDHLDNIAKELGNNYDNEYVNKAIDLYNIFFKESTGKQLTA